MACSGSSSAAVMQPKWFSRHSRCLLVLLCFFVLSVLQPILFSVEASSVVVQSVLEKRVCYGFDTSQDQEGNTYGVCRCKVKPCEDGSNENDKEVGKVDNGAEHNLESGTNGSSRRQLGEESSLVVKSALIGDDESGGQNKDNKENNKREDGKPKLFYERGICLLFAQINTGCSLPDEPISRRLRSSGVPANAQTSAATTRHLEEGKDVVDVVVGSESVSSETAPQSSVVDSNGSAATTTDDNSLGNKEEEQSKNVDKLLSLSLREVLQDPMPFAPTIAKFAEDVFKGQSENAQRFGPGLWQLFEAVTAQFGGGGDGDIDVVALLGGALTT
eukprot:GHVS01027924.1.p1 GENE.GHVS01027924.1~~GHVS01027924.1.p1  ORF type:complete len:331 (+),score=69.08 GHVS01027924.1:518-1510(+)